MSSLSLFNDKLDFLGKNQEKNLICYLPIKKEDDVKSKFHTIFSLFIIIQKTIKILIKYVNRREEGGKNMKIEDDGEMILFPAVE